MYKFLRQTIKQSLESDNLYKETKKLRTKLFLGCMIFSLVLLFAIMAFNLQHTYSTTRNDVIEMSKNSSIQNAKNLEMFFLRHGDILLASATALEHIISTKNTNYEDVRHLLQDISIAYNESIYSSYTGQKFTGIYTAFEGSLIHGIKTPKDLPKGYNPLERPWYKEAIAGEGKIVFGEPYKDIYTPYMVMTATKLLEDNSTVIAMDITLNDLQFAGGNMDVSVRLNGQEYIYGSGFVLTSKGVVVAHSDKSEQGACYDDPKHPMFLVFEQIKQCIVLGEEYFETVIDGITYGVFPQKLNNGWYVVTLTDLEDISNSISDFSIIIIIGTFATMFIVLLYCFLLTRWYIKSRKLSESLAKALVLARKDGLTGYSNRTAYDMFISELNEKLNTKNDMSFTTMMIDLNDLKYVNDHYGHAAGDEYIRNSCKLIKNIVQTEIYRIGGDEFAIFLIGEEFKRREELCALLRKATEEGNLLLIPNVDKPSIAIGTADHIAGTKDDIESLLRKADAEMYKNKAIIKMSRV